MSYADGALTLRAFITLRGHRWHDGGHAGRRVRTGIVEVQDQPVRLPFGFGSYLLGSNKPLHDQLDNFVAFVGSHNVDDFSRAQKYIDEKLKLKGTSLGTRRKVLQGSLLEEEVHGLPWVRLEEKNPWAKIIDKLPNPLRVIAAGGIPAYGTRHRWTLALAREAADLVPPAEARALMAYWLNNRPHTSEDVETDPITAQHQTEEIIDSIYRKLRGIPEAYWTSIAAAIRIDYGVFSRPVRVGTLAHAGGGFLDRYRPRHKEIDPQRKQRIKWRIEFSLADALATAFFIARRFFKPGAGRAACATRSSPASSARTRRSGCAWSWWGRRAGSCRPRGTRPRSMPAATRSAEDCGPPARASSLSALRPDHHRMPCFGGLCDDPKLRRTM